MRKEDALKNFMKQRSVSVGQEQQQQINFLLLQNDSKINRIRYHCGRIINNDLIQQFIILVIIFNSIMLGLGTFNFVSNNPVLHRAFGTMDFICLCLFTVEITMQMIYRKWHFLRDPWLAFDLIVVAMSWVSESMEIGRAFRIIRASRIIVRTHGLRVLVAALISCIPKIFAVGMLLVLVLYVYGVIFTSLFKDLYDEGYLDEDYFSRLDRTVFTLFQMMTMDSWSHIAKQVMVLYPQAWIPFVSFILTTTFLILNLAVGVICDAVAKAQKDEIEHRVVQVSSEVGERNDVHIRALEDKIDALTAMVETLARQQQSHYQSESIKSNHSKPDSFSFDTTNLSTSNTSILGSTLEEGSRPTGYSLL
jgi:voltage-gated sodium channel